MIIPNEFSKLEYDPTTDILYGEWPDIHDHTLYEVKIMLSQMLSTINNYDVKKVLSDSRKTIITVADDIYNSVVSQLTEDLKSTRLHKFARVTNSLGNKETAAREAAGALKDRFVVSNFTDLDQAMEWLKCTCPHAEAPSPTSVCCSRTWLYICRTCTGPSCMS
jgi:hypothetical protein